MRDPSNQFVVGDCTAGELQLENPALSLPCPAHPGSVEGTTPDTEDSGVRDDRRA